MKICVLNSPELSRSIAIVSDLRSAGTPAALCSAVYFQDCIWFAALVHNQRKTNRECINGNFKDLNSLKVLPALRDHHNIVYSKRGFF